MLRTSLDSAQCPMVGEKPHQPRNVTFPRVTFGKYNRHFCAGWFNKWSWLHWDVRIERAYCHVCITAFVQKKLTAANADPAFITRGYVNWKNATAAFKAHEISSCHKEAVAKLITLPASTRDVGESLSAVVATQKSLNRACFMKVLSSIRYLARQGLALRGDDDSDNFTQMLKLCSEDNPVLLEWLNKKTNKYTAHDIQIYK